MSMAKNTSISLQEYFTKFIDEQVDCSRHGSAAARPGVSVEGIDHLHPSLFEIHPVPGCDGQPMQKGGRGDQTVFDGHGAPCRAKASEELRPPKTEICFARKTLEPLDAAIEPLLQPGAPPSPRQQQNPESNLAEYEGIDHKVALVATKPVERTRVWSDLRRLAQDVGVNEVGHSASVDSDSMGTKNPFSGHASSQSTSP